MTISWAQTDMPDGCDTVGHTRPGRTLCPQVRRIDTTCRRPDAHGYGVAPAADVVVSFVERSMLRTGRSTGWGTSLYGLTEEEIGIVEGGV